jgi:protein-L-isoaspartate(D-aspartate) O-methyltransferase
VLGDLAQSVISIERHPTLAQSAAATLAALGYQNVRILVGDGTLGCPDEAPFDRIIVTAATDRVPPALWEQLAEGGLLVIPLGDAESQTLQAIRKVSGIPQSRDLCACRFVPLVPNPPLTPTPPEVK